jgi:inosose dehydratase
MRSGDLTYKAAVRAGLFRPLGQGDLNIRGVLDELDTAGYQGWFVLEQDTALDVNPGAGEGPIRPARQSLEFFRGLHGVDRKHQEETA